MKRSHLLGCLLLAAAGLCLLCVGGAMVGTGWLMRMGEQHTSATTGAEPTPEEELKSREGKLMVIVGIVDAFGDASNRELSELVGQTTAEPLDLVVFVKWKSHTAICHFPAQFDSQLRRLRPGQEVTVSGVYDGHADDIVMMKDCRLRP